MEPKPNVLLISPITKVHSGVHSFGIPALGIHRIASYLRYYGYTVDVYDCNLTRKPFVEIYKDRHFGIIGISILNITLIDSLTFIKKLRILYPEVMIIAGGIEATLNYQTIIDNSPVDAVCLGEGEEPMLEICRGNPLGLIDGLVVKNYAKPITNESLWQYWDKIDFRNMGYQEYWEFNRKLYDKDEGNWLTWPLVRLVSSSHCRRSCSFCSVRLWHEQSCGQNAPVAYLSPSQIAMLLTQVREQLPETKIIYFVDDDLLVTRKRAYELVPILAEFPFNYLIQTHTSKLTEDIVKKFSEVGVMQITCGVENCSEHVRKSLNKPQDEQKIEDIILWCDKYGIRCYYLIILFTGQTRMEDLWINHRTLTRWITQGAIVSIEPFEMLYRGSLDYDSDYDREFSVDQVNGRNLRQPTIILPKDPQVRRLMMEFRERWPEFKEWKAEEEGERHFYKGATGKWMVALLGELLEEYK